jgi:acrylyl-CoA reductase (NADPH)
MVFDQWPGDGFYSGRVKAFVISELDHVLHCDVSDVDPLPSSPDDVLVRVEYSGVNFKDSLVAMSPSRVRRVNSVIGGVDAAGVVVTSGTSTLPAGTRVAVHGGDLGVGRDGGYAQFVYAPANYISALAPSISTRDAMVIGTAGFTAMASVLALEAHGLSRGDEVLVTGATGGVGSMAVTLLALRGYEPVASTGSINQSQWLVDRGAVRVIGQDDINDRPERALGAERWAGAVDCVGGETLSQILRSLRYGASVAASGLVASAELSTNVYPFITRAVNLLGIDSVLAPFSTRQQVWTTFGELAPRIDFEQLVDRVIPWSDLTEAFESIRNGSTRGRILVEPATE